MPKGASEGLGGYFMGNPTALPTRTFERLRWRPLTAGNGEVFLVPPAQGGAPGEQTPFR